MAINELHQTPNASRLHIAILGRRNQGKSSLINAISSQDIAIVSSTPGTTTDPVFKPIEILPAGPCVLIDTAGFDDEGSLGEMRIEKTREILNRADIAVLLLSPEQKDFGLEKKWLSILKEKSTPVIGITNKIDLEKNPTRIYEEIDKELLQTKLIKEHFQVSAKTGLGIDKLKSKICEISPQSYELETIASHLINSGDHVLLVAPQDIQAPKGRLILPQVQTIRDLLDNKAIISIITTDKLKATLDLLKEPPKLIITDSQVFKEVKALTPENTLLTSFSVLMARYKGDIEEFLNGAEGIDSLNENSSVLILEACSHNPLDGDIGRIKIPNMLRNKFGKNIQIHVNSGPNIPKDLEEYDLIIHCGGCMLNRKTVLSRLALCKEKGIPITNYGIFIAYMNSILSDIVY